jgi:hypothetical protein
VALAGPGHLERPGRRKTTNRALTAAGWLVDVRDGRYVGRVDLDSVCREDHQPEPSWPFNNPQGKQGSN